MRRRVLIWCGAGLTVCAWGGMAAYVAIVGLDEADKAASVTGAFLGLAGLALTVLTSFRTPAEPGRQTQRVAGSAVGGSVIMTGDVRGSLRIGSPRKTTASGSCPAPESPGPARATSENRRGQTVDDSAIAGSVSLVGDVGQDVDIDR